MSKEKERRKCLKMARRLKKTDDALNGGISKAIQSLFEPLPPAHTFKICMPGSDEAMGV